MNALALPNQQQNILARPVGPRPSESLNAFSDGVIKQGSWLDFWPILQSLIETGKEVSGVAPSERVMNRLGELRSPVLRPQNAFQWADYGAGLAADTIQTGMAGADLAALAPMVGRRTAVSLGNEIGAVGKDLKNPFKDSIVKNKVYHGDKWGNTEVFKDGKYKIGAGFFTDDYNLAKAYADRKTPSKDIHYSKWERDPEAGEGVGKVVNAYIDIKKPITEETTIEEVFGNSEEAMKFREDDYSYRPQQFTESIDDSYDIYKLAHAVEEFPAFREYILKKGYDGFIFNDLESGGTTYIPFKSSQIKHASRESGGVVEDLVKEK